MISARLSTTIGVFVILAVIVTLGAAPALAGDLGQRVAIDSFRGPQGGVLQDAVESALLRRYFLVPDAEVTEAARRSGVRLRSDEDFAEVGRSLKVAAFVSATVRRSKNWRVEMVVRNGETGEAVARYDVTDRRLEGLAAALARATPRRLQLALATPSGADGPPEEDAVVRTPMRPARSSRPRPDDSGSQSAPNNKGPTDDDEDAAETASDDAEPSAPRAADVPRPYLEVGAGGRVFSRSMTFTQNFSNIPAYRLDRATAVTVDMALHPFAIAEATRDDWIAGFGLIAAVTYAMGVTTEVAGADGRARTEVHGWELGLRYRSELGPLDLVPRLGFLAETFAANVGALSPDVDYRVVRAGLGARLALSRQAFMRANLDYLDVLSTGRLSDADRFPRAVTRGIDVGLGAGYAFGDTVEVWLSVGLRRYGYDLKVKPGDSLIAGGALDEYVSMSMGLTYRPIITAGGK